MNSIEFADIDASRQSVIASRISARLDSEGPPIPNAFAKRHGGGFLPALLACGRFRAICVSMFVVALTGCGGGGGGEVSAVDTSAAGASTADVQLDTLASIGAAYAALTPTTAGPDGQAMLTALLAMPEVTNAEITQDGVIAYLFNDGTSGILDTRRVFKNAIDLPLTSGTALSVAAAAPESKVLALRLATGRKVYLFDALDAELGEQSWRTISDLKGWFTQRGYSVNTTFFTRPLDLRNIRDADVVYIDAHGGIGKTQKLGGDRFYAIATGIPVTATSKLDFAAEIAAGEVGFYGVPEIFDPSSFVKGWRITSYLFITPKFIKNHMTFKPGALVFVNGCEFMMDGPETAKTRAAFSAIGATVQLGWTGLTSAKHAAETALYLFDRVLGANGKWTTAGANSDKFSTSPPNRPFDVQTVYDTMKTTERRLYPELQPPFRSTLKLTESSYDRFASDLKLASDKGDTIALVPSIGGLYLDNVSSRLQIDGTFGAKPSGSYSVTVGGQDVTSQVDWTPARITIPFLPSSGAGSVGQIVVTVDGAASNPGLINGWRDMRLTVYAPWDGSAGTGAGIATVTTSCRVNFRAATSAFRRVPDGPVSLGSVNGDTALQDGTCDFNAAGFYAGKLENVELAFVGSSMLPWADPATRAAGPLRYAYVSGQFQAARREMDVQMLHRIRAEDGGGIRVTTTVANGQSSVYVAPLQQSGASGGDPIRLNAIGDMLPGSHQETLDYVAWSGAAAQVQEDDKAAR